MKLFMSLSVLIIGFLISTSLLNTISTQALLDNKDNQYKIDSFDRSTWKWFITEVVSTESTSSFYKPSLSVDTLGNVHITWHDETEYAGSGSDFDIFYKRWDATTSSWTMTEVVSTESTAESLEPSLAVDSSGNVHIAWGDGTDYAGAGKDPDIFYKSTTSELETELASLQGFVVLTSLILGTYIFFFTVTRTRKKKSKPN